MGKCGDLEDQRWRRGGFVHLVSESDPWKFQQKKKKESDPWRKINCGVWKSRKRDGKFF